MTTINVNDMSLRQLRQYAAGIGIEGVSNMGRTYLKERIAEQAGENVEFRDEQMVVVDAGDLFEACDAANAWAGNIREKSKLDPSLKHLEEAADRIDQAVNSLRRDSFDFLKREVSTAEVKDDDGGENA